MARKVTITLTVSNSAAPPARGYIDTRGEVVRHKPIRAIVPVRSAAFDRQFARLNRWLRGAA